MEGIVVEGQLRSNVGKKSTKAVRSEEMVPCVLYGGGENIHFQAPVTAFKKLIYTPYFNVAELQIDGKSYKAFVKDTQFHPVSDKLLHLDFQQLIPGQLVVTDLPITLHGLAVGVKAGGKLLQKVRKVRVKALPEKLLSEIKVDVSHLEVGKSVRVRDIVSDGLQVMMSPAVPLASVEITRALRAAAAAAAAAANAKPVKGKKK